MPYSQRVLNPHEWQTELIELQRKWRLLLAGQRSGAENMARDEGLMERARITGEAVFSVYAWSQPTLSFGRNQAAKGKYDLDAIARAGVDIVRRPTGGRALLHHREVTYSVTAPAPVDGSLRDSYERINRILIGGLKRLGVNVSESRTDARTPQPGELPCFAEPAQGELVTNDGKLVGSAQIRENGALLQHGSILIDDDQGLISTFLLSQRAEMNTPRAATLTAALGRAPDFDEVAQSLFDAVKSLEDPAATDLHESETTELTARLIEKYQNELWTWRR
jgi:lipoate-protein ligase A